MIEQFKIEANGAPVTDEAFAEFMVKKCYFKRNGSDFEKTYLLGKDLNDAVQLRLTFKADQGVFGGFQITSIAKKGTLVELSGKMTYLCKDVMRYMERLEDAAARIQDDLSSIEKFLKG